MKPFVDFFHRTELSLKCALGRSDKKLLSILKERGQTHYAAADYAGLDGMVEQLFTCKDNGIIPILGFEAFVNEYRPVEGKELTFKNLSTGEIKQAEEMDEEERDLVTIDYPIGLFALDMTGYHNMMSVHNDAQLNGVWKRPRTSMSFLKGHGKGLLAVLRTPDSEVGSFIYSGEKEKALEKMQELLDMFEDVYLSVTIAKDRDLREIGAGVVEFADENGFKVIPVVNSHYLRPEDEKTWDTARRLAAISRSKGVMPFEIDRAPDMSYHCREEVDEIFRSTYFSRIPVYHEDLDHIVGILHEKDFYKMTHDGENNITRIMKEPVFAPATLPISSLLKQFRASKTHMIILLDEFGGTDGIVTLEDVLEELVGEIYDEHDEVSEEIVRNEDGSFLVDGSMQLEDLLESLGLDNTYDADTVGGWVGEMLQRVPEAGDSFQVGDHHVEVMEMDGFRVMRVRLEKREEAESQEAQPETDAPGTDETPEGQEQDRG